MAERKKDESAFDIIAKGMTSFIKAKTSQAQAKLKMQSALKLKDIERKQNFMYKIAEQQQITPYQKIMGQIAQKEYPGLDLSGITGGQDQMPYGVMTEGKGARPEGMPSKFGVKFGKEGITMAPRKLKDIVERIHMKPQDQWTEKERGLVAGYKKMQTKDVTTAQRRKEDIQKKEVLEILKRGWGSDKTGDFEFQDRAEASDYIIDKYDIDITDPDVQNALTQYKEREERIAPARKGFFGIGKREYPTKQKYGFTYEKRPDGKWHKIEE